MSSTSFGSMPSVLSGTPIPGRILPGLPPGVTNQKMTELNDLIRVGATRPHILDAVAKHFAERKGMLSELLMYMGKSYNPATAYEKKKKGQATMRDNILARNIRLVDNHEIAWRIKAPTGFVYKIVETVPADVNGYVGAGGAEFYLRLNRQLGDMDDVIVFNDQTSQAKITAPPVFEAGGTMKVRCRMLWLQEQSQYVDNFGIPADRLVKGAECMISHNIKPEASEHGSKTQMFFGDWAHNWMTTQRYEWNMTGHAVHNQNNKKWMTYIGYDGTMESYWVNEWHYLMMERLYETRENMLWNGKPYLDKNGNFERDLKGRTYWSGTGIYHQANRRLKREYNKLTIYMLEDMMKDLTVDGTYQKPTILVLPGMEFRSEFGRLLRREFKYSPEVMFYTEAGLRGQGGMAPGSMGLKSNFTYLETELGIFVISNCSYFDNRWMPKRQLQDGSSEQSHRAIMVNLGDQLGTETFNDTIVLTSMAGRQSVIGKVQGMSRPNGGVLTTTADIEGEHILDMAGAALLNPNCMAEFRKVV